MINEFTGEWRWLSNFWDCAIRWEGRLYPSVENAYQATKTRDIEEQTKFQYISAHEAKRRGKLVDVRPDWDQIKLDVMLKLLRLKFSDPELRGRLLATGDEEIQEGNWWGDTFWGVVNGYGENNLGRLLMQVRDEIRQAQK